MAHPTSRFGSIARSLDTTTATGDDGENDFVVDYEMTLGPKTRWQPEAEESLRPCR
jgi:hypothetical protein